ncbi:putative FMN-dependent luciferase-like monooxygenase [Microvirga lotononidis]|uniref:Putative FMN-dependent luciferase-like monooxygenase, KPN_01858 family n=1 Tax=Microvirga lotononidis TaxID=864069 RepID=I4YWQ6_9HYPH|nr:putative FMN-dependent luciferase-like monooxygenase [Microvirga lotononidis]EIM28398.1 putative FMN-dependent luciferase-like monooxygenase, KPN_01858 family [Microvirga lotononidis]WQO27518.1 putative FMN-dependent luciferase-like monooxygenase [Microvirga lotononidis]
MTTSSQGKRLGFFTRLLDEAGAAERYRLASEQIVHAERHGFDSAWVAQHHFHEAEGGLPSPLVFLSHVAAQTSRIRLGTGIITLPLENPVRVAEDAVVLDLLSGGRLEVGVGTGGTPSSFTAFGLDSANRSEIYDRHLAVVRESWDGRPLNGGDYLYPSAPGLNDRVWQATFSVGGGIRAGKAGDGLMLSRTQPRPKEAPRATLPDIQHPIIDAYLEALPDGRAPRIVASRSLFVADDREEALRLAEKGLRRVVADFAAKGHVIPGNSLADVLAALDTHVGTPADVLESLSRDTILPRVTDLVFQVHSVDPPHEYILRSIELIASEVAPALGWHAPATKPEKRVALVR